MSFILDALRRADAQRERDASRGIHAQAGPLPGTSAPPPRARRPLALAIGALAVVAAGGMAWQWSSESGRGGPSTLASADKASPAASPSPAVPIAQPVASVAASVRPADAIQPPPPPPAPRKDVDERAPSGAGEPARSAAQAARPASATRSTSTPQPPEVLIAQAPDPAVPPPGADRNAPTRDPNRNAPPAADAERDGQATEAAQGSGETVQPPMRPSTVNPPAPPAAAQPAAQPAPPPPPPPPPPAVAPAAPPQRGAAPGAAPRPAAPPGNAPAPANAAARRSPLPADAPAFNLTGGVFSQDPSRRMVIVNGQVYGQGSEPVAGVVVEEIRPNAAVVTYRGQRYTVSY
ncbi:general secretion pathway protein GspB [Ramlibacter rhizophilus]|uniref:Type II secretion system protein GspB C-terminal domain-containing protein n=1 Tax=Ramlibacter rhizophilus TaxID=1781167 RepID=A0A4Z0BGV2_9BURK|nr:general secretion pathway protein GspB [Ramlibacter rhizophilus]TFY98546.1 hypothetical protein EZ242_13480 [Ramlibacter rhizophilus]